jgi:hypothetical protein
MFRFLKSSPIFVQSKTLQNEIEAPGTTYFETEVRQTSTKHLIKMATKAKRAPKYKLMLILKAEYQKPGRPDNFEMSGNNLEKLLLFAQRHTSNQRNRVPRLYLSVWRNTRFDPYEGGEMLLWTRLPY